jgi:glycosyltransferase involved in cell wall biosynthesis
MRILHVIPSYKPAYIYGGPIESVSRLCEKLVEAGAKVDVFTTTANGKNELDVESNREIDIDKVSVIYFKRITKDPTHISLALWWQLLKKCLDYDIVHIHSWWNPLVIISAAICHLRGARVVVSPRGMLSQYIINNSHAGAKRIIHTLIGKWALKRSIFHATADAEYLECRKLISGWQGFTLPNILQLPSEPLPRKNNDVFTLLYLSRIHPKKGLEVLLESLSQIETSILLKIAGNGEETYIQALKNKVVSLNIESKVEWIGWKNRDSKFEELAQADLFVLPSYNENFANSVIESLAVGTPVLITFHVGLASYVQQNNLGWITEINSEDIAKAIISAMKDHTKRLHINKHGRKVILNTFSAATLAEEYTKSYNDLIKPKNLLEYV